MPTLVDGVKVTHENRLDLGLSPIARRRGGHLTTRCCRALHITNRRTVSPAGRPEIGTPINIRLGNELLAQVDTYAEDENISRAEAIRQLVREGLRRSRR